MNDAGLSSLRIGRSRELGITLRMVDGATWLASLSTLDTKPPNMARLYSELTKFGSRPNVLAYLLTLEKGF